MATGFVQRFQGKIKAAELWIGTKGGVYDAASGIRVGGASGVALLALPVTAATNTDFTMAVPPTAVITSMTVFTTTAYGAVTDAKISIGVSAGDATYVAATSIKAAGVVVLAAAASTTTAAALLSAPALSSGVNLWVRIAQSGGNSATGAATLAVEYTIP